MSVSDGRVGRVHTLEVSCQSQNESYPASIELVFHILPSPNQHNSLCGISSRRMENGIHILPGIRLARGLVLVSLPRNLQAGRFKELLQLIIHPIPLASLCIKQLSHILGVGFVLQRINLMLVPSKHILVAAGEVRMDLSWQKGIFGDVCRPRITV